MEDEQKLEFDQESIEHVWTILELWLDSLEKHVDFVNEECRNVNEQKAQAACFALAIMGNLGDLARLHKAITDYETYDLERLMEGGEGGMTEGKKYKHEEFVRLVSNKMKYGYDTRMNVMRDVVLVLKLPEYETAFNLWKDFRLEDFQKFKTSYTGYTEDYITESKKQIE